MFGGVPIRVVIPPSIVANDSGMRMRLGLEPCRRAVAIASGINIASAPTLLTNPDNTAPIVQNNATWRPIDG